MAGQQPARSGAGETINEFMARRRREVADRAPRARAAHEAYGKALRNGHGFHVGHPGLVESFIPVWGSAREAIADEEDGNAAGAAFNTALAGSDLFLAGDIAKAVGKGGVYAVRGAIGEPAHRAEWSYVRAKMGGRIGGKTEQKKMLEKHQPGHHWLIPQKATNVPAVVRNHPLNIKAMPSEEVHGRVHGRYKDKPQFGLLGQYQHGTPTWSKVAIGSAVGHAVTATTIRKNHR